jgi:hypothetical protein
MTSRSKGISEPLLRKAIRLHQGGGYSVKQLAKMFSVTDSYLGKRMSEEGYSPVGLMSHLDRMKLELVYSQILREMPMGIGLSEH